MKKENRTACAFTGYRPEKLPFGQDEESPGCMRLKQQIFCETLQMTDRGVTTFLSGMARGVDTWAAETVLQLRTVLPPGEIQFWAILPYAGQADAWNAVDRERYRGLLARADKVVCLSETYTQGCMQTRNRYLVDHANFLIAVYDGKPGGTRYTVEYARKKGLEIVQIEP